MTTQEQITINNLRGQIHGYEAREDEMRKFLRLLNKNEDSLKPEYLDAFMRVYDKVINYE
jgi:hypothetical protein